MIRNILKKDLKRKKTMNIIILLFVILSAMFVASSVNNIVTVANGTGYYFEKAGLGDFVVLTMGENVVGSLDNLLSTADEIKDYRVENVIYASQDNFLADGEKVVCKNTALLQCLEDASLNFFNEDNKLVNKVEPGHVYATGKFLKNNNLKPGDTIRILLGDEDITLIIDGKLKDALLGSDFMGNSRFLLSKEDYGKFAEDEFLARYHSGQICYVDTDDVNAFGKRLSDVDGIGFSGDLSLIRMCYVMDMVVAGVLIVLSICLIIVAFVVLKFTITFTLEEEFREIGVMKAIGIKDKRIRSIYLVKYLAISVTGALLGFFVSIPFGNMLMRSVSENMVLGNDNGVLLNVISSVVVVMVIVAYAYHCTGKIKRYSPVDAIRCGQTGERYKKKSTYRIGRSRLKTTSYMALNDLKSSPKRYLTIILAFSICSLLVLMIVNTTETMKSDKLAYTFGKVCDVYYTDVNKAMKDMNGEGHIALENTLDEMEELLMEHNIPAMGSIEVQYRYKVSFNDEEYRISCQQGVRTKSTDYVYEQGDAPRNEHEIAITRLVSEKIGAKIGDTIRITVGDKEDEYVVVAYFQTLNLMGEVIRLHEDVPTDLRDSSSMMSFQFDFTDNPSKKVIDERVTQMKDIFDTDSVFNTEEYTEDYIGVVDIMSAVELLLLIITLVVVVLVTILMERSFISDEKGEIAILKAIGFTDKSIVTWHVKRFAIVSVISVLIAVILSVPMTKLCITPIFGMMGLNSVSYKIDVLKIFVIFPAIILAVTMLAASITAG